MRLLPPPARRSLPDSSGEAKVGGLAASVLAFVLGILVLRRVLPDEPAESSEEGSEAPEQSGS